MDFKDNIARIRKEKRLTQEELANLCNVSIKNESMWEDGLAQPSNKELMDLVKVLQVTKQELLGNASKVNKGGWGVEYVSKWNIFGLPLIHIDFGWGRKEDKTRHFAKGVIAIGNTAVGVFAIGFMSAGLLSIGFLTLGLLFAVGCLAVSYLAIGLLAIGYISVGLLAIGVYSVGMISIGYQLGIGTVGYGNYVIGNEAYGEHMYIIASHPTCFIQQHDYRSIQDMLHQQHIPKIIEAILKRIPPC